MNLIKKLSSNYLLAILLSVGTLLFSIISCQREIHCPNCNKKPIAIAGPDQTIILPLNSVTLDGSASKDPDGKITGFQWRKISGPDTFNLRSPNSDKTNVDSLKKGIYQFELKVTDNSGLSDLDTVQITVNENVQLNRPPVANAGVGQTITLPGNYVNLDGSSSSDPDNNIVFYKWKKISGPASFNIANDTAVQTLLSNLVEEIYQFELKVTDAGGLFDADTVAISVVVESCDNSNRPVINAQLIPVGTLSLARYGISVAAAGNKIVFGGGFQFAGTGDNESSRVDIFDISTNTWSSADLSVPREGSAAISAGNKIFFAGGGYIYSDYYSNVDIYDVSTNRWTTTSLTEAKTGIGAATVGNKVFFAGGETISGDYSPNNFSKKVEIYDLTTNTWSMDTLSEPRSFISGVTVGEKMFFAGGNTPAGLSNKIEIFDNSTQRWSFANLNYQGGGLVGTTDEQNIYWSGAGCNVGSFNVNSLSSSLSFLHKKNAFQSVIKDGKVIFFHTGSNLFDIYDPSSNQWSVGKLISSIPYNAAIISVNNTIYLAGGSIDCISIGNGGCALVPTNQVYKLEF